MSQEKASQARGSNSWTSGSMWRGAHRQLGIRNRSLDVEDLVFRVTVVRMVSVDRHVLRTQVEIADSDDDKIDAVL